MNSNIIRLAEATDLPIIMQLVASAKAIMRKNGNQNQWNDGYPSENVIMEDIQNGSCRIIMHGNTVVGSFVMKAGPDPTYSNIYNGRWLDDKPYYVIHRITSREDAHGIFEEMLDYCFNISHNIRIDTHKDNTIMRHLLEKNGFKYCGIIHIANGDERMAYQKVAGKRETTITCDETTHSVSSCGNEPRDI